MSDLNWLLDMQEKVNNKLEEKNQMNIYRKANYFKTLSILAEAESVLDECFAVQDELLNKSHKERQQAKKDCLEAVNRRLAKLEGSK